MQSKNSLNFATLVGFIEIQVKTALTLPFLVHSTCLATTLYPTLHKFVILTVARGLWNNNEVAHQLPNRTPGSFLQNVNKIATNVHVCQFCIYANFSKMKQTF